MGDQFQRLAENQTVSSLARRIATKLEKSAPPDSLDLALASSYDHHAIWGAGKAKVVKQDNHCLSNHAGSYSTGQRNDKNKMEPGVNFTVSQFPYRTANIHIQSGITPSHTSNSKRGYSRGPDGTFYAA